VCRKGESGSMSLVKASGPLVTRKDIHA